MSTNGILLAVEEKSRSYARIYSSLIDDEYQRKRAYAAIMALFSYVNFLKKSTDAYIQNSMTLYRTPKICEEYEIADFYINNYHIDVRITTNTDVVFIPKVHYDNGIVPDFYAVIKADKGLKSFEFVGAVNTKKTNPEPYDYRYYRVNSGDFISNAEFIKLIDDIKAPNIAAGAHEKFSQNYLSFIDNEIGGQLKKEVLQHVFDCADCRTEFCCFIGFEMVSCYASSYSELFDDKTLDIIGAQAAWSDEYKDKETSIHIEDDEKFEPKTNNIKENISNPIIADGEFALENDEIKDNSLNPVIDDKEFALESDDIKNNSSDSDIDDKEFELQIDDLSSNDTLSEVKQDDFISYEEDNIIKQDDLSDEKEQAMTIIEEETDSNSSDMLDELFDLDESDNINTTEGETELILEDNAEKETAKSEIIVEGDDLFENVPEGFSVKPDDIRLIDDEETSVSGNDGMLLLHTDSEISDNESDMSLLNDNKTQNSQKVIIDYDESGLPVYSYITDTENSDSSDVKIIDDTDSEVKDDFPPADNIIDDNAEFLKIAEDNDRLEFPELNIDNLEPDEEIAEIQSEGKQEQKDDKKEEQNADTVSQTEKQDGSEISNIFSLDEFPANIIEENNSENLDDLEEVDIMDQMFYDGALEREAQEQQAVSYNILSTPVDSHIPKPQEEENKEKTAEYDENKLPEIKNIIKQEFKSDYKEDEEESIQKIPVLENIEKEEIKQAEEKDDAYKVPVLENIEKQEIKQAEEKDDAYKIPVLENIEKQELKTDYKEEEEESIQRIPVLDSYANTKAVKPDNKAEDILLKEETEEKNVKITEDKHPPEENKKENKEDKLMPMFDEYVETNVKDENETEEEILEEFDDGEDEDMEENEKSSSLKNLIIIVSIITALLALSAASAFFVLKNKNKQTNEMPTTSAQENRNENTKEVTTVPVKKLTEKDLLPQQEPSKDMNKAITKALALSANERYVTLKELNWLCAPELVNDLAFKTYIKNLDNTLKLNLKSNIMEIVEVPPNKNIKVKLEVDNERNLRNVTITESSGSEAVDEVVLRSINETFEGAKSPILTDSPVKADKYFFNVVIKL